MEESRSKHMDMGDDSYNTHCDCVECTEANIQKDVGEQMSNGGIKKHFLLLNVHASPSAAAVE